MDVAGPLIGFFLLAIGFVLFAEMRKNYRKRGRQLVGPAVALVGALLLWWSTSRAFLLLFVAVAVLMLLNALGQFVMGRRLDRARAALPPAAPKPPRAADPAAPPPPPFAPIVIDLAARAAEARGELVAGAHRNPTAVEASSTLFLWVFAPEPNSRLMEMVRRTFGPVEMLHGGGYLVSDLFAMPRILFGRGDDSIEVTEDEVLVKISRFHSARHFGRWPVNSMLCSDGVWQFALDRLLERSELVVMDLTDFTPEHAGCEYEIGLLVDRVAASRCLFVVGPSTDLPSVVAAVEAAWRTMAPTSPNRDPANGQVRLVRGGHLRDQRTKNTKRPDRLDVELALVAELMREGRGWRLPPPRASAASA